jgi:hypothetical protein
VPRALGIIALFGALWAIGCGFKRRSAVHHQNSRLLADVGALARIMQLSKNRKINGTPPAISAHSVRPRFLSWCALLEA